MTPTHCNRHHRKYRYYRCSNYLRKKSCTSDNKTLPAGDVEEFVVEIVRKLLKNPAIAALTVHNLAEAGIPPEKSQEILKNIDKLWETLHSQEQ